MTKKKAPICNGECLSHGHPMCTTPSESGYVCTRTIHHTGLHVACNGSDGVHGIEVWDGEEDPGHCPMCGGVIGSA